MLRAVWILGVLFAIATLVQVAKKAERGQQALVRWTPQLERLADGGDPYARSESGAVASDGADAGGEGFPGPPSAGLLLMPFARLGAVPGSVAFGVLKAVCAAFLLAVALRLAFEPSRVPWIAALLVLLGCARVLASDMAHGNSNLVVAGAIAAAALAHARRMEAMCGFWIALAAGIKLTPALFVVLFLVRRSRAGLIGAASGALFAFAVLPGAAFGFAHGLELVRSWADQMVVPYLEGRHVTLLQSEHTNQSLFGLGARLLTDSVAIAARGTTWEHDVSIAVLHLGEGAFLWVHRVAALAVVAATAFVVARPRARRDTLGVFALLALATVLVSERSWKQHYVVIALPLAYLAAEALESRGSARRLAAAAFALAVLLVGATGSGLLGDRGSDLAEAYGAFTVAALVLWATCAALHLRGPSAEPCGAA
ncbi:MAG: glycosyltransferase family 87 protein [Planctomycetota bacterium]